MCGPEIGQIYASTQTINLQGVQYLVSVYSGTSLKEHSDASLTGSVVP